MFDDVRVLDPHMLLEPEVGLELAVAVLAGVPETLVTYLNPKKVNILFAALDNIDKKIMQFDLTNPGSEHYRKQKQKHQIVKHNMQFKEEKI